jgi:hypothetical protein
VAALVTQTIAAPGDAGPYCAVDTAGRSVQVVRPGPGDPVLDDVNWFARPVPNAAGHHIVAVASHNLNYLYDLTSGTRVRIPDTSDAVATPDGRFITVPSHYTATHTVNFYDAATLLARLAEGRDAADVPPVYAHAHPDVYDVYYQSVGIVSTRTEGQRETTVYRMMFSGSTKPAPPGFRIVDYTVTRERGAVTVAPTTPMRLCPQITRDLATPFISKDGRYVAAHDDSRTDRPASLKIFEILATDPAGQTSTCAERVDFGFAAGKADFSFDGKQLTFHISKHDYLTPFVSGGIAAPAITDVVVVDLVHDAAGRLTAPAVCRASPRRRLKGGPLLPAFLPDGALFFLSNSRRRTATRRAVRTARRRRGPRAPARATFHVTGQARAGGGDRRVVASELLAGPHAVPAAGSGVGVCQPVAHTVPATGGRALEAGDRRPEGRPAGRLRRPLIPHRRAATMRSRKAPYSSPLWYPGHASPTMRPCANTRIDGACRCTSRNDSSTESAMRSASRGSPPRASDACAKARSAPGSSIACRVRPRAAAAAAIAR